MSLFLHVRSSNFLSLLTPHSCSSDFVVLLFALLCNVSHRRFLICFRYSFHSTTCPFILHMYSVDVASKKKRELDIYFPSESGSRWCSFFPSASNSVSHFEGDSIRPSLSLQRWKTKTLKYTFDDMKLYCTFSILLLRSLFSLLRWKIFNTIVGLFLTLSNNINQIFSLLQT